MLRMRGQVSDTVEEPRSRHKFDRMTATPLQIQMQNIQQSWLEEMDWSKQWKNFTKWGMEDGHWKTETKFLENAGIKHLLGAPQVVDFGRWKEEATKFIISRYHEGYVWLDEPIAITRGIIHKSWAFQRQGSVYQKPPMQMSGCSF
jgi:hypothetical protein